MRAWTVDADDIRVAEDFDDALLHHTPEIDSFLNLERDDKFIVIGTKGFGKTLLLIAFRAILARWLWWFSPRQIHRLSEGGCHGEKAFPARLLPQRRSGRYRPPRPV